MEKILITPKSYYKIREKMLPLLQDYEVKFNDTGRTLSESEMVELAQDVSGIIVGIDPITEKVIKNARNLKAISKYGVGMDNIDLEAAESRNIKISKAAGTNNISVAELTITLILNICKNITGSIISVKKGGWERVKGLEVTGKTIGLIGCGSIGKEVAKRAKGLLMSIMVYDPYFDDEEFKEKYEINQVDLETLLKSSDFVSLHLPLNSETKGIIMRKELELMKSTAYLINTARGELINEADLFWALKKREIAGAACDVFSEEPPGNHPILELDNFILTPHIGANTREAVLRMATVATENLLEMLSNSRFDVKK